MNTNNRCAFGVEIEYRATFRHEKERLNPCATVRFVPELVPAVRDHHGNGFFTANGGRWYPDPAGHIEYATPECATPLDLVRFSNAGHRLAESLAEITMKNDRKLVSASIARHNIDYTTEASWATHFSISTTSGSQAVLQFVVPFLATKMIFDGAGGFCRDEKGIRFSLSPRMELHKRLSGGDTQGNRALVCTRANREGLNHRAHLTGNETLCSNKGDFLRAGSLALVFKMLDAGFLARAPAPVPDDVMTSIRIFAADPTLRARVPAGNRQVSAIEIQRHYLDLAESCLGAPFMPPWAGEVVTLWRSILGQLESGWESCVGVLDWPTKLGIFEDYAGRSQGAWAIKAEPLFEIDARFGELGKDGIWEQMEKEGVLAHRLVADAEILQSALTIPPMQTRAKPRGEAIMEISRQGNANEFIAAWHEVVGPNKVLALPDVFASSAKWKDRKIARRGDPEEWVVQNEILTLYRQGDYIRADKLLRNLEPQCGGAGWWNRYNAWVKARLGQVDWHAESLDDRLLCSRMNSLLPPNRGDLDQAFQSNAARNGVISIHLAAFENRWGFPRRAKAILDRITPVANGLEVHIRARLFAELAETSRFLGEDRTVIESYLEKAAESQSLSSGRSGEYYDITQTYRAKMEAGADKQQALALLHECLTVQRRLGSVVAEARTTLLGLRLARGFLGNVNVGERIGELETRAPSLSLCPGWLKVTEHIDQWLDGDPAPSRATDLAGREVSDDPFWLL